MLVLYQEIQLAQKGAMTPVLQCNDIGAMSRNTSKP